MSEWGSDIEVGQYTWDLPLMPEDEQAGESSHSRALQYYTLPESYDSFDRCRKIGTELCPQPSRDRIEAEHGEQPGNVEKMRVWGSNIEVGQCDGWEIPLMPKDERESSHSRIFSNPNCSFNQCRKIGTELCPQPSRDGIEAEHGEQPGNVESKEFKLACALTRLTAEGFYGIYWSKYLLIFSEHMNEFDSFCVELFGAMARFVWNLYDEEDFENIEFTDDIFKECERIRQLIWSKGNFEPDLSLLDIRKYEKVREQDVCNLLRWCNEKKSPNNNELAEEFSEFKHEVVLIEEMRNGAFITNNHELVEISRAAMLSSENLDPNGVVKQQLRMDLIEEEYSCIVDALCMQSLKDINFQKLVSLIPKDDEAALGNVQVLAGIMCEHFYWLVQLRIERLRNCERLVTYPLSAGNIFGSWGSDVVEVVKQADRKRRSEGRRFIGTDHLVFCLHQRLASESAHAKNYNILMSSDAEEKHKDTVYHLYQKANKIATQLGDETIGLEHLYVAIITSANDDKCSWKDYVKRVREAINERKGKCKAEDETRPSLWDFILEDNILDVYRGVDIVEKIKDNKSLQRAIQDVLAVDKKCTHQMSEREMISYLKKNVEISFFKFPVVSLTIVCLAATVLKLRRRG